MLEFTAGSFFITKYDSAEESYKVSLADVNGKYEVTFSEKKKLEHVEKLINELKRKILEEIKDKMEKAARFKHERS